MRALWRWPTLLGLSFAGLVAALALIFLWVPTEATMGIVQRIFYFHVPLAWVGFLAFFLVFLGGIVFLWRGSRAWDRLAYAAAEIGVVFATLNLLSGILWARPVWGDWWVWDPRLTSMLVLWLIYLAYLLVRGYSEAAQAARYAAVVGIAGFVDVPMVFFSIRWWSKESLQHPKPVLGGGEEAGLAPSMTLTLMVSLVAFTLLFALLLLLRTRLRRAEEEVAELKEEQEVS